MSFRIQITVDGKVYPIAQTTTTTHPKAVHDAMGTSSERELQHCLDQMYVGDWYDDQGCHRGPDVDGLEMFWDDELAASGTAASTRLHGRNSDLYPVE